MRERRKTLLPSVLVLTFVTLLVAPITVSAASGLPATITMQPASASPGSSVEIVGLDFAGGQPVDIQVTTTAGPVHLATVTTAEGGYFRATVTLPADVAPGFWELRATGVDGRAAAHIFEAGEVAPVVVAPAQEEPVSAATESGGSGGNVLVVLVLLALIGGIGGAAAYVYRQLHRTEEQPGMATGDDPIWGGAPTDT